MSKLSTYPTDTAPGLTDELLGLDSGVTARFPLGPVLDLAASAKAFQPRGVNVSGDTIYMQNTASTASPANLTMWVPLWIPEPCTLDEMSVTVTTLESGAVARLGLYTIEAFPSATSVTGTLVADYGTIDASTTGVKTIASLAQACTRGLYAFCAAASNHSTVRYAKGVSGWGVNAYPDNAFRKVSTDHSGALPSTVTGTIAWVASNANQATHIFGKFS